MPPVPYAGLVVAFGLVVGPLVTLVDGTARAPPDGVASFPHPTSSSSPDRTSGQLRRARWCGAERCPGWSGATEAPLSGGRR